MSFLRTNWRWILALTLGMLLMPDGPLWRKIATFSCLIYAAHREAEKHAERKVLAMSMKRFLGAVRKLSDGDDRTMGRSR